MKHLTFLFLFFLKQLFLTEKRLQERGFQGRWLEFSLACAKLSIHMVSYAHCLRASVPFQLPKLLLRSCSLLPPHPSWWIDSLLFQPFYFPCFCSDWWVQGWYFSCHSTLISYLRGRHWKRLLKGSKLSDILKSHLLFPVLSKPKGSLPSSTTAPSLAPTQVCCHFPLLLICERSPLSLEGLPKVAWWRLFYTLLSKLLSEETRNIHPSTERGSFYH